MKALSVVALRRSPMPLAYVAFAVYLVLAIVHARERMLNSDCSLQLFRSINDRTFFFQEARYGMFITQLPMLIGVHCRAPMNVVVLLYSAGLAGTYGCCVLLAHRVFRSPEAALAIMLSLVIGVGDSFFHATTETHLLLALSGLLYAALDHLGRSSRKPVHHLVVGLLTVWCLFTHPNALFTIGSVTALLLVRRRIKVAEALGVAAICASFFCARLILLPADSYDGRQFEALKDADTYLPRFFDLFPVWFIRQYLEREYVPVVIMLVIVVLFVRPWYTMLLTILSASLFWILTILTFHEGNGEAMMEKSFMPGIFMLCIPFAILCHHHRWRKVFLAAAALMFCFGLFTIASHRHHYGDRLDALAHLIRVQGREHPKILVLPGPIKGTDLGFCEWATSIDALMLSRCLGDTARTVFVDNGQQEVQQAMTDPSMFLYLPWQPIDPAPLDTFYFNLPSVPYQHVPVTLRPRIGRFDGE